MKDKMRDMLENNPIIAAVKSDKELELALNSEVEVIFVLYGDILNVENISEKINYKNKVGIVHIDLIEGLASREISLKFIKEKTKFKGIVTTKQSIIKMAKSLNLFVIYRIFIFDSLSFENAKKHSFNESDAIEILPGVIPKVIKTLSEIANKPIIVGGLIESKEESINALKSGATCISTTEESIWGI